MKKIKIFLASSLIEFKKERNWIGDVIRQLQDQLLEEGVYIHLFVCEFFDKSIELRRKQESYNDQIKDADIFLLLLGEKIGAYTQEEYEVAKNSKVKYCAIFHPMQVKMEESAKKFLQNLDSHFYLYNYQEKEEIKMYLENTIQKIKEEI